jgi:hypothetical protein
MEAIPLLARQHFNGVPIGEVCVFKMHWLFLAVGTEDSRAGSKHCVHGKDLRIEREVLEVKLTSHRHLAFHSLLKEGHATLPSVAGTTAEAKVYGFLLGSTLNNSVKDIYDQTVVV